MTLNADTTRHGITMTIFIVCAEEHAQSQSRFTGKERDSESGNDYFGARYYASSMGRWLSPDTDFNLKRILAEPQRWNRYAYVLNNPLILVDPNGLWDIYVFRPEAKSNSAAWNRTAADAKANGNTMHILNGSAGGWRTLYFLTGLLTIVGAPSFERFVLEGWEPPKRPLVHTIPGPRL